MYQRGKERKEGSEKMIEILKIMMLDMLVPFIGSSLLFGALCVLISVVSTVIRKRV